MTLLDLFCGAGGCAIGYRRAGFTHIIGVDKNPQPNYPFSFIQTDAIEYLIRHGRQFDAIHASPPCQRYSALTRGWCKTRRDKHPDLVGETRDGLILSGRPWVIENVVGAPLSNPIMLCGSMFGLGVRRHRLFELSFTNPETPTCDHKSQGRVLGVYGHPGGRSFRARLREALHGRKSINNTPCSTEDWAIAMGINWMTGKELAQAIPPAYTEWIGRHLLATVATNRS